MAKGSNKGKTRWLDDEVEWGRELAGHYGVAWDDAEDWDGDDWDEEGEEIDEVAESLRAELLLRIRAVVPEGATPEVIAPGCDPNDLTATIQTAEQLFTPISPTPKAQPSQALLRPSAIWKTTSATSGSRSSSAWTARANSKGNWTRSSRMPERRIRNPPICLVRRPWLRPSLPRCP
jgi:hypothetical protein